MKKYIGLTYPSVLCKPFILKLWRRYLCWRKNHLFDEVFTSRCMHYLVCDACQYAIELGEGKGRHWRPWK